MRTDSFPRWTTVDCADFLEQYTDYRDGLLPAERADTFRAHMEACAACARYDRVISAGTEIFRSLPAVEPSSEFFPRLQHRIFQSDYERVRNQRRASHATKVMVGAVAIAIVATATTPLMRERPAQVVELPPVTAHAPHRIEPIQVLFRRGPLLTPPSPRPFTSPAVNLLHDYSQLGTFASSSLRAP